MIINQAPRVKLESLWVLREPSGVRLGSIELHLLASVVIPSNLSASEGFRRDGFAFLWSRWGPLEPGGVRVTTGESACGSVRVKPDPLGSALGFVAFLGVPLVPVDIHVVPYGSVRIFVRIRRDSQVPVMIRRILMVQSGSAEVRKDVSAAYRGSSRSIGVCRGP